MEIAEECPQDNLSRLLAQSAVRQIQFLLNQKVIDQSFVRIVLENKDNLHNAEVFWPPSPFGLRRAKSIESITRISYLFVILLVLFFLLVCHPELVSGSPLKT